MRPEPDKFCAVHGRPTIAEEAAQDNDVLVALVRLMLPDYNDEEARACITDPHAVLDLQRARDSRWLTQIDFEEELLCLFVNAHATKVTTSLVLTGADPAGLLTSSAPSPAGCTSGGLGAQDATASARGRECLSAPSPIPRDVPGTQVPMEHLAPPPRTVDMVCPPGGCAAPTALQPSLQAASTSKGSAPGSAVPIGTSGTHPCPKQCFPRNHD